MTWESWFDVLQALSYVGFSCPSLFCILRKFLYIVAKICNTESWNTVLNLTHNFLYGCISGVSSIR